MFSEDIRLSGLVAAVKAGWMLALAAFVMVVAFGAASVIGSSSRASSELHVVATDWIGDVSLATAFRRELGRRTNLQGVSIAVSSSASELTVSFVAPNPMLAERAQAEFAAIIAELKVVAQANLERARADLQARLDRSEKILNSLVGSLSTPQPAAVAVDIGTGMLDFEDRVSALERKLQNLPTGPTEWIVSVSGPGRLNETVLFVGVLGAAIGAALLAILLREALARARPRNRETVVGET